jgi:hypothetical protein
MYPVRFWLTVDEADDADAELREWAEGVESCSLGELRKHTASTSLPSSFWRRTGAMAGSGIGAAGPSSSTPGRESSPFLVETSQAHS